MVDARAHLMGRLASKVAKELLCGQHVVIVRCEEANVTGSLFRNQLKFHDFLAKRTNTNPRRGPFHFKAPSKMVWRAIRGMLPHKSAKGAAALQRLKVFEGVPPPYDKVKKVVVPDALRVVRLKPGRSFARLGDLATKIGWKYEATVGKLEQKRKRIGAAFYKRKKVHTNIRRKAVAAANEAMHKDAKLANLNPFLVSYGY